MPVRSILKARFVPSLTLSANNAIPFTWDGGDYSASLPGGRYLPHELALEIERAMLMEIAQSDALTCAARSVADETTGALLGISLVVRERAGVNLTIKRASETFTLPVSEDAPLAVGAAYGSANLALAAGEEGVLLDWPMTGAWPLSLPQGAVRLESEGRVDAESETGRRVSWAGRAKSALRARLLAVPRSQAMAPANWSFGDALWQGGDAPLCALFGPGSAAMQGAPFFLCPNEQAADMVALQLSDRGSTFQRRLHGFLDIGFEAEEQPALSGLRRLGEEYSDDFSGDLSNWSGPANWSIVGDALQVDTSGSLSQIAFIETLGNCEIEASLRFLASPAEGESVRGGVGLHLGGSAHVGIALRGRRESGEDLTDLVTWTNGTTAPVVSIALLRRALPSVEPVRLRVQFLSNPQTLSPQSLLARVWVGEEGPFTTLIPTGISLPLARSPILFYQDDLAVDPGAEALFDDFAAREVLCDFTPDLLQLENMEID